MQLSLRSWALSGLFLAAANGLTVDKAAKFGVSKKDYTNLKVSPRGHAWFLDVERLSTKDLFYNEGTLLVQALTGYASPSGVTEIYFDSWNMWYTKARTSIGYLKAKTPVKMRIESRSEVRIEGELDIRMLGLPENAKSDNGNSYDLTIAADKAIENRGVTAVVGTAKNPVLIDIVVRDRPSEENSFYIGGGFCMRQAMWTQLVELSGAGCVSISEGAVVTLDSLFKPGRVAFHFHPEGALSTLVWKRTSKDARFVIVRNFISGAQIRFEPPVDRFDYDGRLLHFYTEDGVKTLEVHLLPGYEREHFKFDKNSITYEGPEDVIQPSNLCRCPGNWYKDRTSN